MPIKSFRTEQDKTHRAARDAVQLGLTNTNPILIDFAQSGATEFAVNAYAIQAISNVTFTTLGTNLDTNGDDLAAVTLPAGHILYVRVKTIELAGGILMVYQL